MALEHDSGSEFPEVGPGPIDPIDIGDARRRRLLSPVTRSPGASPLGETKLYAHNSPILNEEFNNAYRNLDQLKTSAGRQGIRGVPGDQGAVGDQGVVGNQGLGGPGMLKVKVKRLQTHRLVSEDFYGLSEDESARLETPEVDQNYLNAEAIDGLRSLMGGNFIPRPIWFIPRPFIMYRCYANFIRTFAWTVSREEDYEWLHRNYGMNIFSVTPNGAGRPAPSQWAQMGEHLFGTWPFDGDQEDQAISGVAKTDGYHTYPKSPNDTDWFTHLDEWDRSFPLGLGAAPGPDPDYGWHWGGPYFRNSSSVIWWTHGQPMGDWQSVFGAGIIVITMIYQEMYPPN
jgi:hypothetical protein